MIRVLVVEDSSAARELLVSILSSDPQIEVVGEAVNGRQALELARRLHPDLICMDVHMPDMDGMSATREIMEQAPTRIVLVTSVHDPDEVQESLDAMQLGALTVIAKPEGPGSARFARERARLLSTVKAMATVQVVRRRMAPVAQRRETMLHPVPPPTSVEVVAIAASTGGPAALKEVLSGLPRRPRVPILVVQHIAAGFVGPFATWLASCSGLRARVAVHGERLEPATVYIAPDGAHLGVDGRGAARLADIGPIGGFRPSASFLFESVGRAYGPTAAMVILTGMGSDGVPGLRTARATGSYVLAQDEATSVVYGMPREAVAAGLVHEVLPLPQIGPRLAELLGPS